MIKRDIDGVLRCAEPDINFDIKCGETAETSSTIAWCPICDTYRDGEDTYVDTERATKLDTLTAVAIAAKRAQELEA